MARTPEEIANQWSSRMKQSTQRMQDGVNNVSDAPGKKAAAKKDKMRQNLLASIDDGTWEKNVAAVSLEGWKQSFLTKGIPRIAAGVDNAQPMVAKFHSQLQPHQQAIKQKLAGMPDLSLEDNINRAVLNIREMSKFKFNKNA